MRTMPLPVKFTTVLPTFVAVTVFGRLVVQTGWLPKFRRDGTKLMSVAAPVRLTVCGLAGALSTIVSLPLRVPGSVGLKVTCTSQFAPGGTVEQPLVGLKSPLVVALVTVTVKGNALLAVTVSGGLVVLTGRRGNFKLAGEKVKPLQLPAPPLPAL